MKREADDETGAGPREADDERTEAFRSVPLNELREGLSKVVEERIERMLREVEETLLS